MSYPISARDYLRRAEQCLENPEERFLFYAALELRCGVEARMQQYLEVWDHVSKKKKQGWRIADLGSASERAFKTGDRIMRWEVYDKKDEKVMAVLYYTPVTRKLQMNAKKLGNVLHSAKKLHPEDDPWWNAFRQLLEDTATQLRTATTGTLLGPALMYGEIARLQVEVPPGTEDSIVRSIGGVGESVKVKVDYLNRLPDPLEEQAIIWNE